MFWEHRFEHKSENGDLIDKVSLVANNARTVLCRCKARVLALRSSHVRCYVLYCTLSSRLSLCLLRAALTAARAICTNVCTSIGVITSVF